MSSVAERSKRPPADETVNSLGTHVFTDDEALRRILAAGVDLCKRLGKRKANNQAPEPEIVLDSSLDAGCLEYGLR
jgi:hypothetical protein